MADVAQLSTGLRRGTLEFCVLAMVEHEDRYGTEIVRRFGEEPNLAAARGHDLSAAVPAAPRRLAGQQMGGVARRAHPGATTR